MSNVLNVAQRSFSESVSQTAVSKKVVFVMIILIWMDLVVCWTALESKIYIEILRTYKGICRGKLNAFSNILIYLSILFKLKSIFKLPLSPSAENRKMLSRTFWGFITAFCKHCSVYFIEYQFKLLLDLRYGSYDKTSCLPQIFWPE